MRLLGGAAFDPSINTARLAPWSPPQQEILRYRPAPGAPLAATATPALDPGVVEVAWEAPLANSHTAPIAAYEVFRNGGLVASLGAEARTWHDAACDGLCSYAIRAVSADGAGDFAEPPPTAPRPGLRAA